MSSEGDRRSAHHCHARGCTTHVPPEMLMCRSHWFMVHQKIRAEVWETYREGQCDDMDPSAEWHAAADAAIGYVAAREGHPLRAVEVNALSSLGFEVYDTDRGELRRWPAGVGIRRR